MKARSRFSLWVVSVSFMGLLNAYGQYQYISPVPDSKYHPPQTGIILRPGPQLDASVVMQHDLFTVVGSASGRHQVHIRLAEDQRTVNLVPLRAFVEGEEVTVSVAPGMQTITGERLGGVDFRFQIRPAWSAAERQRVAEHMKQVYALDASPNYQLKGGPESGFPDFTINTNDAPAPGEVFFSHFSIFGKLGDPHYCIIKSNGDSVYGKYDTILFNNFELNNNGYLTVYHRLDSMFVMLDSNYLVIDTFQMKNGYIADVHEFVIFMDGTHYMLCYDPQIVDMTVYNPTYNPAATVIGCVFQKLDKWGNVLLQWRSWDHIDIMDASNIFFQNPIVDYVHANAIFEDVDSNIWLTSRHLSEVTKIDYKTGNIIWRMGGKKNQFTFINDSQNGFSHHHDAHRLANGNMLVFDNGVYHIPARTSVKEYVIDETNKTATLVWSYSRAFGPGYVFSKAMGNAQRLANGNTLINWGLTIAQPGAPKITEVDASGTVVWEMTLNSTDAVYRAQRHVWEPCARPSQHMVMADKIKPTSATIRWNAATNATTYDLQYRKLGNTTWKTKGTPNLQKRIKDLTPQTTYEYRVKSKCANIATKASAFTSIKTFTTPPLRLAPEFLELPASLRIAPNPAVDVAWIELQGFGPEAKITIYDLAGNRVWIASRVSQGRVQIPVGALAPGLYIVECRDSYQLMRKKFVKQ